MIKYVVKVFKCNGDVVDGTLEQVPELIKGLCVNDSIMIEKLEVRYEDDSDQKGASR